MIDCSNITLSERAIHRSASEGFPPCFVSLAASALLGLCLAIKSQNLILPFPPDKEKGKKSLSTGITMRVIIFDFSPSSSSSQSFPECQQTTKAETGPPSGDKALNRK